MSFAELGLAPALVDALTRSQRLQPTPIQQQAVAPALAGRDLLALAPTGSGKTLAYVLPLLQQILFSGKPRPRDPQALVLLPTRELAQQVGDVLRELARSLSLPAAQRLRSVVAHGGVSINPQLMALRGGADIVIATPGRLLDLLDHNGLHLGSLRCLVLDEADRLLALGFADELDRVLAALPTRRQTLLFSATFGAPALAALAQRLLQAPLRVQDDGQEAVAPQASGDSAPALPPSIQQRAIVVDSQRRTPLLRHLLKQLGEPRSLVFVATRHAAEMVSDKLWRAGHRAAALHGELGQGTRQRVLQALASGEVSVLVATDVAARGLDIPGLALVVNHDLPRSADDHRHRIGRTGRAGASGQAISFVPPESEGHFRLIEKRQGLRVPRETVAGFEPARAASAAATGTKAAAGTGLDPNGGIKGRRKSRKDRLREADATASVPPTSDADPKR